MNRLNQKGMTLVEVLVSLGVLTTFIVLFVGFQSEYIKNFSKLSTDTGDNSSLKAIIEEIMKDERYIVPMSSLGALEAGTLSEDALAKSFASALTENRCYDKNGARVISTPGQPECHYAATLYRVMLKDRRYGPTTPYAKVPMSRMNIRVVFPESQKGTTKTGAKPKMQTIYFSKLVTHILPF